MEKQLTRVLRTDRRVARKILSAYTEALSRSSDSLKILQETFSEKQNELFENYLRCRDELTSVVDCENYITAFKLGAKIMIDVLTRGEVSKI